MASTPKRPAESPAGGPEQKKAKATKEAPKVTPEMQLQIDLLNSDPELKKRFEETVVKSRPADVTMKAMAKQFWAARAHLLRAFAIERDQKRADNNALSYRKTVRKEGRLDTVVSSRQINEIFRQHPIVRRAFDELVPKKIKDPALFWGRFWSSRLCKRLKGQRVNDREDYRDPDIDRYVYELEEEWKRKEAEEQDKGEEVAAQHVPRFIDVEGNEQNHSQRKGNQPDSEMRPSRQDAFRIINRMSEQLLAHSAPTDRAAHAPIGMDEETYNQLRLRDLQADAEDDRVKLNIRDPGQIHAGAKADKKASAEAHLYASQDPQKVLTTLRKALGDMNMSSMPLTTAIGYHSDSSDDDSDDEKSKQRKSKQAPRFGGHTALAAATSQIHDLLQQQRLILIPSGAQTVLASLSPSISQNLTLTHDTTIEFLRYFWTLMKTSSPSSKDWKDMPSLLQSLSNSLTRIESVAKDAEQERRRRLEELRRNAQDIMQRSEGRRKVRVNESDAGPGAKEVNALMAPLVRAMALAKDKFATSTNST